MSGWRDELISKKKLILEQDKIDVLVERLEAKTSQFAKIVAGDLVIINKTILFEILEKRTSQGIKVEDLFLLCKAPNGQEGEDLVETPYGKLRVFFINADLRHTRLLHKSKYNYPSISKVSTKGSHKTTEEFIEEAVKIHVKDATSVANENIKKEYRVN